jgi:magnesium-transporting ATPase (P-type)
MAVERLILADRDWEVTGAGFLPEGEFRLDGEVADPASDPVLSSLIRVGLLCNEAEFSRTPRRGDGGGEEAGRRDGDPEGGREGELILQGDPTEGALLVLGVKAGMDRGAEEHRFPRVDMIPFESERRWMATLHRTSDGGHRLFLKGAPERILEMCSSVRVGVEETGDLDREAWSRRLEEVAAEGHRLLALAEAPAEAPSGELTSDQVGTEGVLLGVVALMDPPRPEAVEAVASCRDAGIRVMMITGDHAMTARSIGARMGIGDGTVAVTGAEIEEASDEELSARLGKEDVVARASPEHKLRIVRLLQEGGEVCAMTGDGVNDAPALKQADIGVAMGIKGSEAAKSASEMVLADDNFASIERAVAEGRTVFDNLKKTILFILPTNGAEALIVLAAVVFAFPHLPISPVQILWVNMVTAVTLALALAFEPGEEGIMARPPRSPGDPILSRHLLRRIAYVSVLVASACILLFRWELARGMTEEYARTAVVNALVAAELWYLFNCRFLWRPSIGWSALVGNRAVLVAAGVLLVLQAGFTYLPFFHLTFGTAPLAGITWAPVLSVGLVLYLVVETEKGLGRRRRRREAAAP